MATARSNCCCAAGAQDTGKCTLPNFSGSPVFSCAVTSGVDEITKRTTKAITRLIAHLGVLVVVEDRCNSWLFYHHCTSPGLRQGQVHDKPLSSCNFHS